MGGSGKPWWAWGCPGEMTDRDRRNLGRFNFWVIVWMVVFLAATVAVAEEWISGPAAVVLASAPIALSLAAAWCYLRFLRQADELLRKIHLEALALGFGAGAVLMLGYRLLERVGAPPMDSGDPVMAMFLGWALGLWIGTRRYA